MSFFDDLGAGLGLLSLHDESSSQNTLRLRNTQPFQGGKNKFSALYTEDPMDVDSDLESSHNVPVADDSHVIQACEVEEPDELDELDEPGSPNTSLMSILSPTALGAHYALKTTKLLMPPPTLNGLDYEFDTSTAHKLTPPNQTTFESVAPAAIFGQKEPGIQVEVAEPPWENAMHRSFQYRHQMAPASYSVVHHHHYYGNEMQQNKAQTPSLGNANTVGNTDPPVSAHSQMAVHLNLNAVLNLEQHTRAPHVKTSTDTILPSPWDQHAVPAERTPYLLSSYLQVGANVALWLYAVYILVSIIGVIRQDVAYKLRTQATNLAIEIALCERSYLENNCHPDTIVPALEKMCGYWEKCMNQDPNAHGNTSLVSAQTIATIVNLLVEPLSFKVLFVFAGALVLVFAGNFAFGYVRAKTFYGWGQTDK